MARQLLGAGKIIGLSVENMEQVYESNNSDVDYIGISPVFSTTTKTNTAPPFGLGGIREVIAISNHPVVAIGGINLTNVREIMKSGAYGIAVVSAICSAESPKEAAFELKQKLI
jgi:thiamine-phosphate pyrophosphorylase